MRKYPILMLALALLLGVSAVFAARAMDAPKDQVAFTERVIYGDPAAADGLTVELHEQYRNYLHWASTLSFTESSYTAHTDYTFEHDRYWNNNSGVVRSLNIWDGVSPATILIRTTRWPRRSMRWRTRCSPARRPPRCSAWRIITRPIRWMSTSS